MCNIRDLCVLFKDSCERSKRLWVRKCLFVSSILRPACTFEPPQWSDTYRVRRSPSKVLSRVLQCSAYVVSPYDFPSWASKHRLFWGCWEKMQDTLPAWRWSHSGSTVWICFWPFRVLPLARSHMSWALNLASCLYLDVESRVLVRGKEALFWTFRCELGFIS